MHDHFQMNVLLRVRPLSTDLVSLGILCGVCVLHKTEKTGQVEDKRSSFRPKNLSTADKYYLKVVSLKN